MSLIWTITDHDCTKRRMVIPCRETMNAEERPGNKDKVCHLWESPTKIISDRTDRFTRANFAQGNLRPTRDQTEPAALSYTLRQSGANSERLIGTVETALESLCNYSKAMGRLQPMVQDSGRAADIRNDQEPAPLNCGWDIIHAPTARKSQRSARVEWTKGCFKGSKDAAQGCAMKTITTRTWVKETKSIPDQRWSNWGGLMQEITTYSSDKLKIAPFFVMALLR